MATAQRRARRTGKTAGARALVQMFRVLTDQQFDFWIERLNQAAASMKADVEAFSRKDRQRTISYWYMLMYLLELYAARLDPFAVGQGEDWSSEGLLTMEQFSATFEGRYELQTVRRYVFDLKKRGLITLDGRGPGAQVQITAPAIVALADTIRRWVTEFRKVDRRVRRLGAL